MDTKPQDRSPHVRLACPSHAGRDAADGRPRRMRRTHSGQTQSTRRARHVRRPKGRPARAGLTRRTAARRSAGTPPSTGRSAHTFLQYLAESRRKSRRPSRRSLVFAIVIMLVVAFAIVGGVTAMRTQRTRRERMEAEQQEIALERSMQVDVSKLSPTDWPSSTPRDQWRAGSMPYLYQTDPAWAYKPYAGGTVRTNACGPTSLCMVYIYLTGRRDLDPGTLAQLADSNGFAPTGATEWSFMTRGAAMIGINGRAISPDRTHVENALRSGRPVICSMRPGTFTNVGHYLVLHGVDGRGMVRVFDPNSPINSARSWGLQTVLLQTAMAWEFSL